MLLTISVTLLIQIFLGHLQRMTDKVNRMFSGDLSNPFDQLRVTIEECLRELVAITYKPDPTLDFGHTDLTESKGPWALVEACYIASENTHNITDSKASKMLHRKQPTFISIIDGKLVSF